MKETFLVQAVVYLGAAVLTVPVAKRLGLGSVLGYLLAGIAVGPHALHLVGEEGHDVMHFAEFGVVMMLFLVGLELRPSMLWRMRAPIFGLGGAQVAATSVIVAGLSMGLGLAWNEAVVLGMIASASSTAIALQSLGEKGLLKGDGGRASFAVLLFQDIAVIPMLAVIPLPPRPVTASSTTTNCCIRVRSSPRSPPPKS
jgi:Kef-type K+ transport system membrane component KefB